MMKLWLLIPLKGCSIFLFLFHRLIYNLSFYCSLWYTLSIYSTSFCVKQFNSNWMKAHPLINFNPCLPTFKLTTLNYQGSWHHQPISFFSWLYKYSYYIPNEITIRTHSLRLKQKPFCLNFFHCTYFYIFKIDSTLGRNWMALQY